MKTITIKLILLTILSIGGLYTANSQSISVIRTDVDSSRADFVTATYMFSFEIKLEDIKGVNNASFKLQYNHADVVHFSGARIGDFGIEGTQYSFSKNPNSDEAQLSISVFSGKPLGESDFDDPTIITLEFVVTPSADNGDQVRFSFPTALATQYIDGEDQIVTLASTPIIYDIHGFVDVWPGDANSDGTAEIDDMATIGLYIEHQNRYLGTRSFKRKNASTNWYAQRVLVWDEADATFADCDGDGDISVSDGLVVFLNESKVHSIDKSTSPSTQDLSIIKPDFSSLNTISIPIKINSQEEFFAIKGKITCEDPRFNILGIESGEIFINKNEAILNDVSYNSLEFLIGTFSDNIELKRSGIIANLILENGINTNDQPIIDIEELIAYDRSGNSFNPDHISSINTAKFDDYKIIDDHIIIFSNLINSIELIDILGRSYSAKTNISSSSSSIDISSLQAGSYFVLFHDGSEYYSIPFIIGD